MLKMSQVLTQQRILQILILKRQSEMFQLKAILDHLFNSGPILVGTSNRWLGATLPQY